MTDAKKMSLSQLRDVYMSVMHEAASLATQSPTFKLVVAELKRRGIRSLTTLERKMAAVQS